jgi:hypothetical protein
VVKEEPLEEAITASPAEALGLSPPGGAGSSTMYRTLSTPPVTVGSPPANVRQVTPPTLRTLPAALKEESSSDLAPYKDPRRVTKAYFSISCASALGTALIRFSSAPDNFTISQSWGWKSSALRSEEYLTSLVGSENGGLESGVLGWVGELGEREGSLRATVVIGVV